MDFSRSNLTKAIYYVLTLNPNKRFTTYDLLEELELNNACTELTNNVMTRSFRINALREIESAMRDASNEYNNVYCIDGKCYLKQRNKYVTDWESHIKTETKKTLVNVDEPRYDGDSLLHLLCKSGENELIECLAKNHNIDLTRRNSKGESVLDVTSDDVKTLKMLLDIVIKQTQNQQSSMLEESLLRINQVTKTNNQLTRANDELIDKVTQLKSSNYNLKLWLFRLAALCLSMFVIIVGHMIF